MAFTKCTVAVLVFAALAAAAAAQDCTLSMQPQTASLANVSPKGCLKQVVNATGTEDLVKPECFNKLKMNMTNGTGTGCPDRTFTVAFSDQENCAAGFDEIANGTLAAPKAGKSDVKGAFLTGTPFKGSQDAKGQFIVAVEGSNCELTYTIKSAGKAIPLDSPAGANATGKANATGEAPAKGAAGAPAKAGEAPAKAGEAPAPKKSAGAAATASLATVAGLLAAAALLL